MYKQRKIFMHHKMYHNTIAVPKKKRKSLNQSKIQNKREKTTRSKSKEKEQGCYPISSMLVEGFSPAFTITALRLE